MRIILEKIKDKSGFTLIELLIVIAIIGILAVALLPTLTRAPSKGRDAQRIEMVTKISNILRYHYSVGTSGLSLPTGWVCIKSTTISPLITFIKNNLTDFGGVFPTGPSSSWDPYYGSGANWCYGGYGYCGPSGCGLSSSYKFSIFSRLENLDKANSCSAVAITSTVGCVSPYFTVLVQN